MKRSENVQLELNFDGEQNNVIRNDGNFFSTDKNTEKSELVSNVDYSFNSRLANKKHLFEQQIYKEIIALASHI